VAFCYGFVLRSAAASSYAALHYTRVLSDTVAFTRRHTVAQYTALPSTVQFLWPHTLLRDFQDVGFLSALNMGVAAVVSVYAIGTAVC
jgi:hypothetical protein